MQQREGYIKAGDNIIQRQIRGFPSDKTSPLNVAIFPRGPNATREGKDDPHTKYICVPCAQSYVIKGRVFSFQSRETGALHRRTKTLLTHLAACSSILLESFFDALFVRVRVELANAKLWGSQAMRVRQQPLERALWAREIICRR